MTKSITIPPECMPSTEAIAEAKKTWRERMTACVRSIVRSTSFYVATFTDYQFDKLSEPFATKEDAALYSRGFVSGAGRHGPGWVRAFVLPDEHADLVEWSTRCHVDIKPALAAMAAALEAP